MEMSSITPALLDIFVIFHNDAQWFV